MIKYVDWREEYGVNCLSRGDDDIEEQLALGKAEVLDFPDHRGRSDLNHNINLQYILSSKVGFFA